MKIDLHVHTNRSDGAFSPKEIIKMAVTASIDLLSVTDHDTVCGSAEAIREAKGKPIKVIPGIELSTYVGDTQIHLLGYGIDLDSKLLDDALKGQKQARLERNLYIIDRLNALGMPITYEEVAENAKGTVGRKHIAEAMQKRGYVKSIGEAFALYIGEGGKAFTSGIRMKPDEGIKLLKKAGGKVVLAHPCQIKMPLNVLREFTAFLKKNGLDGMESDYFAQTQEKRLEMNEIADSLGLWVTGGSDFHSFGSAAQLGEFSCRLSERARKALGVENDG